MIKATGTKLAQGVDEGFGEVDFDSPDYAMREYLKRNTWKFSVAKNYNDCTRLSNLLVRKDGSLRPWNEFKKEALFVVGESNRYLKTEYDTAVAGAQMSRLWQEIQRDKHIFPYAQFDVVRDGRTSDICAPLDGVICTVDDPRLAYFFPPNHFNCRTTVRRLRRGVPTNTSAWENMEIPEAFKNNVGETCEIFTRENSYMRETPEKTLATSDGFYNEDKREQRYREYTFAPQKIGTGVLEVFTTGKQNAGEFRTNKKALSILALNGYSVRMLPVINDGDTNPDGFNLISKKYMDVKAPRGTNGKNIMQSGLKEASRQEAAELVIYLQKKPDSYRAMYEMVKTTILYERCKNVETIITILPDESVKVYSIARIKKYLKKMSSNLSI